MMSNLRYGFILIGIFEPVLNVLPKAIPSCVSPERPPQYEVITAGEYVKERLKATYGH